MKLLGVVWLAVMLLTKNKEGGEIAAVEAKVPNERAPMQSVSDNIILQNESQYYDLRLRSYTMSCTPSL